MKNYTKLKQNYVKSVSLLFLVISLFVKPSMANISVKQTLKNQAKYNLTYLQLYINSFNKQDSSISGKVTQHFSAQKDIKTILINLNYRLKVKSVSLNKNPITWIREDNLIIIKGLNLKSKEEFIVDIQYEGSPLVAVNPPWQGGLVWQKDSIGRDWWAVACESLGASIWFPCKDTWADEPDSVDLFFTIPKEKQCISNGNLIAQNQVNDSLHQFHWKVSYSINLYNITFNIGYYKHTTLDISINQKSLLTDIYFLDYHIDKAKSYFPQKITQMFEAFYHYFGSYPFPKDGYALVETPYWGMEHQSCVAYGNKFRDKYGDFPLDFILIHETAHEYFGNRISAKDPADMWLHEGFTTYAEYLFIEYYYGKRKAAEYLWKQESHIINQSPIVAKRGTNFHKWNDNDIYNKGARFIHFRIRYQLDNDDLFFSLLKEWATQPIGNYSTEDFISFIEKRTKLKIRKDAKKYLYGNEKIYQNN